MAISGNEIINLFIWIVVLGVVFWLLLYMINTLPGFAPYNQVARVILTVLACLILIVLLLRFAGIVTVANLHVPINFLATIVV